MSYSFTAASSHVMTRTASTPIPAALNDTEITELTTYHPAYATTKADRAAMWDLLTDQGTTTIVDPVGGFDLTISGATFNADNPTLVSGSAARHLMFLTTASKLILRPLSQPTQVASTATS